MGANNYKLALKGIKNILDEIKKDKIKELVKILDELKLTELSYSDGKTSIKVGKSSTISPPRVEKNISSSSSSQKNLLGLRAQWLVQLLALNLVQNHLLR